MGCDDYLLPDYLLAGRYLIGPPVAVEWNAQLAQQFPGADHHGCRQELWHDGQIWRRHEPPRCHGYHCPNCGAPCGSNGHRNCTTTRKEKHNDNS